MLIGNFKDIFPFIASLTHELRNDRVASLHVAIRVADLLDLFFYLVILGFSKPILA